ncbi:hypothetical protein JMM61_19130 [Rhodovulum sulfidophilum]|uniref:hypothetical protein n=1 Tax=Rhodovulum sulfidophilum TaxID=35806 RepID=UPI00192884F7|nr:hypothetical protein [Rhodovulum sulfidophilum]MBL3587462.1 hypothetical protein [Rhodovulum sulfidophilum]
MTDKIEIAAAEALSALDAYMSGVKVSDEEKALYAHVTTAGCFAAAAYDAHIPKSGGEAHALIRSFLVALIDPLHADLDYLRIDPASGEAARAEKEASAAPTWEGRADA